MTILVKDTLVNLDLVETVHFDNGNATISIVFNSNNSRRFDFFDPDNATEEDWLKYEKCVYIFAEKCGHGHYSSKGKLKPTNPFKLKPITKADLADNSNYKENHNGKENNI